MLVTRASTDESVKPIEPQKKGDDSSIHSSEAPVPYTDYQKQHHHPYIVDHFELGDSWQDKLGGFEGEVNAIESYFKDKIEQGEMKNDVESVREKLKGIYKLCGIDKTERTTMQIEKLAAYIDFLRKTDHIKLNNHKYGRSN